MKPGIPPLRGIVVRVPVVVELAGAGALEAVVVVFERTRCTVWPFSIPTHRRHVILSAKAVNMPFMHIRIRAEHQGEQAF